MKKLKRFLIIILIAFAFLINAKNISAINNGDSILIGNSGETNSGYHVIYYYGIMQSGENKGQVLKLYCIDPGAQAYNGVTTVKKASDFTKNSSSNAKYYGLASIIKNGYHSDPRHYLSTSEITDLVATDVAVRAYSFYVLANEVGYTHTEETVGSLVQPAFLKLAYDTASSYRTDLKKYLGVDTNKGKNNSMNVYLTSTVSNKAISLLKGGFEAAIKYGKNEFGSEVKVSITTSDYVDPANPHGLDVQEKLVTFKIKQTDPKKPGFVKIKPSDIVCNDCSKYGISISKIEYQENGTWKPLQGEIDLAKVVDSRTGYARVKITLNKQQVNQTDCAASIKINYRVPSLVDNSTQTVVVNRTSTGYQRYAGGIVTGNGGSTNMESVKSYTIPANAIGCLSVACDTKIETPECSPETEGEAKVEAPSNIKQCIIGKKDEAGNEYKVYQDSVNNEYCATYCKEDYASIKLNRALSGLKCGSYFKLKASIKGSQDCYRAGEGTTSINRAQFLIDILDAQLDLLDAWNNYTKLKAAQNNIGTGNTVDGSYVGKEAININENTATFGVKDVTYTYHYEAATNEELKELINKELEEATKDVDPEAVEGAYKDFKNVIAKYNSCVTDWSKEFAFNQKVGWEYTELTDGGYPNLSENSTLNDLIPEEDRVLSPVGEKTTSQKVEACTGEVNNEYTTCTTGWTDTNNTFTNNTYMICDINGCRNVTEKVSNAKYVKQHSEASQDYESKEQFYQVAASGPASGAITSVGANGFNVPGIQTTPIPGIPLSLDSVVGGTFRLTIRDLGEFYDRYNEDEKYGRLLDFGGEQERDSIGAHVGVADAWNGEYTCYYKNDCLPCPDCDFECKRPDGGECVWEECPECSVACVNCIFNLGQLQLNNKTISTNNFGSADREYGYNWNINTNLASLELIKDKAEATIGEIEDANTTIYDEENEEALEFEIEMTPEVTNYIRDYNKKVEDDKEGGYGNDSLTCYKYEDENGVIHENLFCYSDFIDELVGQGFNITAKNRSSANDRTDSEGNLKDLSYWTPWTDDKNYDSNVIGGPAWK